MFGTGNGTFFVKAPHHLGQAFGYLCMVSALYFINYCTRNEQVPAVHGMDIKHIALVTTQHHRCHFDDIGSIHLLEPPLSRGPLLR